MTLASQQIGRREGIGIGIETTPGTSVSPGTWMRWLDQDLNNKTDVITNDSAMGIVAQTNDSEVVSQYMEGKLGGKVTATSVGYLLTGFFGSPVTTGAGPYTHTFAMSNNTIPTPALTFSHVKAVDSFRYSFGVIESLEFSVEQGGWVEVSASVKGRVGAAASDTVALTSETEFTSKHTTVKLATNVAGLSGATALAALKATMTLERPVDTFLPLGSDTLVEFDRKQFTAKGEITIRYTDSQYNTDYLANTIKALEFKMANATQSLTFTSSRVRYREIGRSTGKDDVVTQVLSFECEFDTAASYLLVQPVLVNTKTNYIS